VEEPADHRARRPTRAPPRRSPTRGRVRPRPP
jgi:hypothetical protein